MAGWFALAIALQAAPSDLPAARPCTAQELADLTTPSDQPYRLTCQADTSGRDIRRRVLIEGQAASGASLDCGGGEIRAPGQATTAAPTVAVWSRRQGDGWSRPSDVAVRNCGVVGNVRIWGMGAGGSMRDLLASSRTAGHTRAAQSAAPIRVVLDRVRFEGVGTIPLYVGPGGDANDGDALALFGPVDLCGDLSGRRERRGPDPGQ